jgi:hypothetical protein
MKSINIAALLCAAFLGTALAAPASAGGTGSRNLIAPPNQSASEVGRPAAPSVVVRHPTQAGKVSKTMSGNFVPGAAHSWLARGDRHYSLCATTADDKVACSPLAPAAQMAGLEVGAETNNGGATLLTFEIAPGATRTKLALAQAASRFLKRVEKAKAHLQREAVSSAPKQEQASFTTGNGDGCGGDENGDVYDCKGGGMEGGGGDAWGDCDGHCDYPDGASNGEPAPFDPSTGDGIDPNAPEVVIVGERPDHGTVEPPHEWIQAPLPPPVIVPIPTNMDHVEVLPVGCVPGPRGVWVCPPPAPANPFVLPRPKPGWVWKWRWSEFEWCKLWNNCGPKTSSGELKPPAVTPGEKLIEAMAICRAEARAHIEFCVRMEPVRDDAENRQCGTDALENYKACEATALDLYNGGKGR